MMHIKEANKTAAKGYFAGLLGSYCYVAVTVSEVNRRDASFQSNLSYNPLLDISP